MVGYPKASNHQTNVIVPVEKKIVNIGDIKNSLPSKQSERYPSEDYDRENMKAIQKIDRYAG